MALAGIDSFKELADRIGHNGLGERTLRKLADENDTSRTAQRLDLLPIAEATGVPYEFFTESFERLAAPAPDIEGRLAALEVAVERERQEMLQELARQAAALVSEALASGALPTGREGPATGSRGAGG